MEAVPHSSDPLQQNSLPFLPQVFLFSSLNREKNKKKHALHFIE